MVGPACEASSGRRGGSNRKQSPGSPGRCLGGQNVTCLVSFAVHGGGLASPEEPSERNSPSHLLSQSRAQQAEWKVD